MGRRERFAELMHRVGALGAAMELRRYAPGPASVAILTYHHIADDDPAYPFDRTVADATPAQFRRQMELLARYGTPIAMDDLIRALDGAPLPKNPVMVTFDDGYQSVHDIAVPILQRVGIPATLFIATQFVAERRIYWWEAVAVILQRARRARARVTYPETFELVAGEPGTAATVNDWIKNTPGLNVERLLAELAIGFDVEWNREVERTLADRLIMSWDQIRGLAKAGIAIESHSRSHRVLPTLDDAALRDDLRGAKRELEAQVGTPVRALAYPVGRRIHDERVRTAIRDAGYRVGLSNGSGQTQFWPGAMGKLRAVDPLDVRRLSTERTMSEAMWLTQVALPPLAYINRYNR